MTMLVCEGTAGPPDPRPIHTYNNGQPYQIARGRVADRRAIEHHGSPGHSILHGRPSTEKFLKAVRRELKIRKYSKNSISNYGSALKVLLTWFGRPPNRVTLEDVRCWLELMVDGNASASHLSVTLSAIRTAFDKFCCRDVTLGLVTPRRKKNQPVILSPNEVNRVINAAPRMAVKLAVAIMYAGGLRSSELCRLKIADLDFERRTIRVHQGKGGADRLVMLPRSFEAILKAWCEQSPGETWLFPSLSGQVNRHMNPRSLQRWVKSCVQLAGIKKRVTPHSFRHAFATHLLENGTDIRFIQKLLGHQRLETTTIYTKVAQLKSAMVSSPLDQLPVSIDVPRSSKLTDSIPTSTGPNASTPPKTGGQHHPVNPPVGRMSIGLTLAPSKQSAEISLRILGPQSPKSTERNVLAVLDGISVHRDQRQWIELRLPVVDSWKSQLDSLPTSQRDRIQTPEFFEQLRAEIGRRFIDRLNQAPGSD